MGAMGGRPNQALYFVGLQKDELIFLDPHLVQESVEHNDYLYEDWLNCDADQIPQIPIKGRKAGVSITPIKRGTESAPIIKIKEEDRLSYHCTQTRKI